MLNCGISHLSKNFKISKLESNEDTGFLEISVFSEDDKPIQDAQVIIYLYSVRGIYRESATENVIGSYTTDENGKVPPIELPVIHVIGYPEENTDEYHIRVDAAGYYSVIVINAEIYPNTTTSYNVILTPIIEGISPYVRFIIIPEKH
jgi:hypothetical protein